MIALVLTWPDVVMSTVFLAFLAFILWVTVQ